MILYEIHTWAWLTELSRQSGSPVTLATVPASEWDRLGAWGFDSIWLMGVWERSPIGALIAREEQGLEASYRAALPDYQRDDVCGSPYSIRRYSVDPRLGGPDGLAKARENLAGRGLGLILDFVPNHVAPDHPWLKEHPEYFIHGADEDLIRDPASFMASYGNVVACGRDPYFPAWTDTAQLNAFRPEPRRAAVETLWSVAQQCDGVRCDMAMLLVNRIFERTWGLRAGTMPSTEYWKEVIPAVRSRHQDFTFIAEAYWDMEWELQQQGFDYCYDKRLYDRLEHSGAAEIREHLSASTGYQRKLLRFIENHDEPRAAATLGAGRSKAAAVIVSTTPGALLLHEGQFEGHRIKLPVQLRRRPPEASDCALEAFYRRLLSSIRRGSLRKGEWQLCDVAGWRDNESYHNVLAWSRQWGEERSLVVVNWSGAGSQAQVRAPWPAAGGKYVLTDVIRNEEYLRDGEELASAGLYVDLGPWDFHVFRVSQVPAT